MRNDGKERDTEGPRESFKPGRGRRQRTEDRRRGEGVPSSPLSPPSLILLKRTHVRRVWKGAKGRAWTEGKEEVKVNKRK